MLWRFLTFLLFITNIFLLSWIMNKFWEGHLPAVHLYYFHSIDNFINQSYSLVSFPCSFNSQFGKLLSNPCWKIYWIKQSIIITILCKGTAAIKRAVPTNTLGPILFHNNPVQMISWRGAAQRLWRKSKDVSNLLTSLDRRLTIWPIVVFPRALFESLNAYKK